jgi:WD repeat-containing protein 61
MRVNVSKQQQFNGHQSPVYALCKGVGKTFYSAGGDGLVVRWHYGGERQGGENVIRIDGKIFSLWLQAEAKQLLAGTMEGDVFVIDTDGHRVVNKLHFGELPVFDIVRLPGMSAYGVLSGSGTMHLLNDTYARVGKVDLTKSSLRSFSWHPDNRRFSIASSDHKLYLNVDPVDDNWVAIDGPTHSVFSSAYDRFGKWLVAGSRDAQIYVYDVEKDYALVDTIKAHLFTVNHLVAAAPYDLMVSAGRDKHIKIWNTTNWQLLKVIDAEKLDGHKHSVNKLLWLEDDKLLISAGDDRAVMLWNIDAA